MGVVSLAVTQGVGRFNKLAVVKELTPELVEDQVFLSMFLDEARLAARLNHPNIVQTYEVGAEDERYFMAMDYLEGRTLARVTRRLGRGAKQLPLGMHLRVLCETLAGLHYAHELADFDGKHLGIVHRDVTPHNVFLTFDGHVKLVDFGIAKTSDSSQKTAAGMVKGKIGYMAPEQSRAAKIDRRADIFSVGIMLWEAIVGRRMWEGLSEVEVLGKLMQADIPAPASVKPDAPAELCAVCERALAMDPDKRYATAREMLEEIEAYLDSSRLKSSLRELGTIVSEAFAPERAQLKQVIEAYLTKLGSGSPVAELASMEEHVTSIASGHTPSRRDLDSMLAPSGTTDPSVSRMPASTTGALGPASITATRPSSDGLVASPVTRRWVLPAAGLALAAVVAQVVLRRPSAPEATAVAATATAMPAPAPAPTPDKVELSIRVTPADAMLFIDNRPVGNPFRGAVPKDSGQHEVRATASGYEAKVQSVAFDGNVTVDLSLQQQRSAAPPRIVVVQARPAPSGRAAPGRAAGDAPAAPAPAPEISLTGGKAPLRTIDSSVPYGNQ